MPKGFPASKFPGMYPGGKTRSKGRRQQPADGEPTPPPEGESTNLPPAPESAPAPGGGRARRKTGWPTVTKENCAHFMEALYTVTGRMWQSSATITEAEIAEDAANLYGTVQLVPVLGWVVKASQPLQFAAGVYRKLRRQQTTAGTANQNQPDGQRNGRVIDVEPRPAGPAPAAVRATGVAS